ncbi:lysophospholipid acyltransferase family protein [Rhizobium sp. FKL33]|uniref:lysophospholipid acyltransferase family protein n=1 Tax=Rhizobium sp. FKL33 TaxID=2562307 RepID=UPI0010BF8724|nr:lysophospholipid acyltransferase family protein [Rhizobium sp. FKL33]
MIYLRSALFQLAFYVSFIVQMIIFSPIYFFLPRKTAYVIPKNWARLNLWLAKTIIPLTYEIEGRENIPEGGCIIAAKHQSFWDVIAIVPMVDDPVYILKRELLWIPLFGWYAAKQDMIPIKRSDKSRAIPNMIARAREELAKNRQLIIYPEGTRKAPGAEPDYKYGVARLYSDLQVPVVPMVAHAGLFWPRHGFLRQPGHIKIRIMKPIEPGMSAQAFFQHLATEMEVESDRLLMETVEANPHLKLTAITRSRLKAIKDAQAAG